ncbi:MAG: hypothetical protein PF961_23050 [Planctomycetota bacterium]|jgi:hypothetical protein|nr:hypothetical protein [Planctomycetota bacterium]
MPRTALLLLISLLGLTALTAADSAGTDTRPAPRSVTLASPLTTIVRADELSRDPITSIHAALVVPGDAPADLGVGAFVTDDDGRWHQSLHQATLTPGMHAIRFDFDQTTPIGEPHRGAWDAYQANSVHRAGLFFWSASASTSTVTITQLRTDHSSRDTDDLEGETGQLTDFAITGATWRDGAWHCTTGQRIALSVRPDPFPADPFANDSFALTASLIPAEGTPIQRRGFYYEPIAIHDLGSGEAFSPAGPARFAVRFRPGQPGRYQIRLEPRWHSRTRSTIVGELVVSGEPWDEFARVDEHDPRFFSTGSDAFVWPIGINARSINDPRGAERVGSRLSPNRPWFAYEAYLDRWAAGGLTAAEIWMSSWNLALEWRNDWPGFGGVGRYSQANAERLDRLLDAAWERGIRINLVIHNHGQASSKTDAEWNNNPYNRSLHDSSEGGTINRAGDFFTDPDALAGQDQLRRYITARYADHPAILGWKLWTEMNLTNGSKQDLRDWHVQAAARWEALDPYNHPVSSHWSGNYRTPDRAIVAQGGMDYICIDAYHGRRDDQRGTLFADLTWEGIHHRWHGLGQFNKPIMVTEYGGNWDACPEPQLLAEHHHGPWAALVSGYAGSPMLWWLEWVDQDARYEPFHAVKTFIAGEDLRSRPQSKARAVDLTATTQGLPLWCRAWTRPGRILGYVLDPNWGYDGVREPTITGGSVHIGDNVGPGTMILEWWDCDTGAVLSRDTLAHAGGPLDLPMADFTRHRAFKLWRAP